MMSKAWSRGLLVLAVLWLGLSPGLAMAAPKFPALTGRVVDDARLLSPQVEQDLTQKLAALETATGRQVVVATLPDLQGYAIEDYGYQLGRAWGIGTKGRNDGALLLIAPNDRKVRIEVGYGLEGIMTDALSSLIIQDKILPAFRAGNLEQGVVAGSDAIIAQLSLPDDQARAVAAAPPKSQAKPGSEHVPLIFILFVIFWVLSGILRGRGRRGGSGWWLLPLLLSGSSGRGGGWGGGGGGGFGGGGGSFGGGGSSGGW